jgi:hypothetical protein
MLQIDLTIIQTKLQTGNSCIEFPAFKTGTIMFQMNENTKLASLVPESGKFTVSN